MEQKLPVFGTNGYPLQDGSVYGPIHSRRYGYSLGINPLPVTYKFCDFDCVYCQYGWTPRAGSETQKTGETLKPLAKLLREIEVSFQKMTDEKIPVNVITIAGNGEPTLYPEFLELVTGLLEFRDSYYPRIPVGILSDSSQCHRSNIKEALEMLDERCMKLDAGDLHTIKKINKPVGNFDLKRTLEALKSLRKVTIQSLFVQGSYDNTKSEQIHHWIEAIHFVQPSAVQVYTVDRPPADRKIKAVPIIKLNELAELCRNKTGISTEVFD